MNKSRYGDKRVYSNCEVCEGPQYEFYIITQNPPPFPPSGEWIQRPHPLYQCVQNLADRVKALELGKEG